jgi:hypothetical protein
MFLRSAQIPVTRWRRGPELECENGLCTTLFLESGIHLPCVRILQGLRQYASLLHSEAA